MGNYIMYHTNSGSFKKEHTPWNKGLTSEDPRVKQNTELSSSTFRKKYAKGEIKQAWNKGLTKNDDSRIMGVSKALTGIKRRSESIEKSRINAGKRIKEQYQSGERKWWGLYPRNKKIWERVQKNGFSNLTEKTHQKAFQALRTKPNRPENFLIELLNKNFLNEYKYTGNGTMMINRKFPDFTNVNGQKKVILFDGIF